MVMVMVFGLGPFGLWSLVFDALPLYSKANHFQKTKVLRPKTTKLSITGVDRLHLFKKVSSIHYEVEF